METHTASAKFKRRKMLFWIIFIMVFFFAYLGFCCYDLYSDNMGETNDWDAYLNEANEYTEYENSMLENATKVYTGTYVESIQNISFKNSSYKVDFEVWFSWDGNDVTTMANNFTIYNADITSLNTIKDISQDGWHYQRFKVNATVYQRFSTKRFPLGTYQLRFYICPKQTISSVYICPENDDSYVNDKIKIAGYDVDRSTTGLFIHREEKLKGDPSIYSACETTSTELLTIMEISTSSLGLYFKCIIALIGTSVWAFLTLFICTYHNVDSLSMIPAVLFGTMSNILVGANLVPDALDAGLLEYVNIWGIYVFMLTTVIIININNIRNNIKDDVFAKKYGRVMFYLLLITTIIGYFALPISAL